MAKQRKAVESGFRVSKPNRNSLWRFGSAREQSRSPTETACGASGPMAKQRKAVESCCEGFEGFEGVLRGSENVPDSSFEAQ